MRACGECNVCCTTQGIDVLDKKRHEPCKHLAPAPGRGCGIYATRPSDCRGWHCAWQKGELPAPMRPDRTGVVVWGHALVTDGEERVVAGVVEVTEGALDRLPGRAVLRHLEAVGTPIARHMRGPEILVQIRGRPPMVVLARGGMGDARCTPEEEQAIAERRRRLVGL